jgi:hypothetical protein
LVNKQGTWSVGDPYTDDGAFHVKLNGRYVAQISFDAVNFGVVAVYNLWVDLGGWVYAFVNGDVGWSMYVNGGWVGSGDTSGRFAPVAGYTQAVFNPSYTNSPDGTRITAPTASTVTNQDGVWSIISGVLALNGVKIPENNSAHNDGYPPLFFSTLAVEINSHGTAFIQASDSTWRSFAGLEFNLSAGPTSAPVPVDMTVTPFPQHAGHVVPWVPVTSSPGTTAATVTVTMSDGSVVIPTTAQVTLIDQGSGASFEYVSPYIQTSSVGLMPGYSTFIVQVTINGTSFSFGTLVGTT